jgi:hypothetical protein
VIVVLVHPRADEATKAEKIAEARREHGPQENEPCQVIAVRFGADNDSTSHAP